MLSKYNKGCFSLCVIVIFSKNAWVVPLKDKTSITITDAFRKILDKCERKPNKIWIEVANYTIKQ